MSTPREALKAFVDDAEYHAVHASRALRNISSRSPRARSAARVVGDDPEPRASVCAIVVSPSTQIFVP
jgi:hypothetical protein